MKFKTLLTINATLAMISGLAFILMPSQLLASYGIQLSLMGEVIYQFWGATLLGLGLLTWSVRPIKAPAFQKKNRAESLRNQWTQLHSGRARANCRRQYLGLVDGSRLHANGNGIRIFFPKNRQGQLLVSGGHSGAPGIDKGIWKKQPQIDDTHNRYAAQDFCKLQL